MIIQWMLGILLGGLVVLAAALASAGVAFADRYDRTATGFIAPRVFTPALAPAGLDIHEDRKLRRMTMRRPPDGGFEATSPACA